MRFAVPLLFAFLAVASAQKKPAPAKKAPPPPPPPLEAPQSLLTYLFPAGGQRGQTVEATATGTNLAAGSTVLVTGSGVTAELIEAKVATKARISIHIAADAELGEREVRFVNAGGVSNRFRFFVSELPEINEVEPNSEKDKPQRLPSLPAVINGQIMESDRDYFRFRAEAGQTLVAAVEAQKIVPYIADAVPGWFDPCLTMYDGNGKELQYADDFHLKPDPVMFFKVPRDGEYILEIRDIIYRGRGDFIYRLTLGALPYVTHIFPLGAPRGSETRVELHGVNLRAASEQVRISGDAPRLRYVDGLPFAAGDGPELMEAEPNDTAVQAQKVTPPLTINGRIQKAGDVDYYAFHAAAGQKMVMEVRARRLESPLDSILTLFNAKGAVLAENDDWVDPAEALITHHADSRLAYTFPAAGDYVLRIRDVQGHGGEEYAYRLAIAPPQPDFALRITPDNPRLGQGDTAAIAVNALRKDGLDGEIRLSVEGLPPGFVTSEAVIPAGADQASLTITAPPDAAIGVLSPVIVGTAKLGAETITRRAETAEAVMQAFAYTHNVPTRRLFLAVIKPAAYTLSVASAQALEVRQDTEAPIVVKIHRQAGAKAGVSIAPGKPIPGLTFKPVFVPPDKDEATLTLSVTRQARAGMRQNIIISGVMRTGRESITRFAPAIPVVVAKAQ